MKKYKLMLGKLKICVTFPQTDSTDGGLPVFNAITNDEKVWRKFLRIYHEMFRL